MTAQIYNCSKCKTTQLAFEGEEHRLACQCKESKWIKTPPFPYIVHGTSQVMVDYYLDSLNTLADLSDLLIQEAADEREAKEYHRAIIDS